MINIADGYFEETVKAVKQARAMMAFDSMRQRASKEGYMTEQEIEDEIKAAREGV